MKLFTSIALAAATMLGGCFISGEDDDEQNAVASCRVDCDDEVTSCKGDCSGDACRLTCDMEHEACVAACR